MNDRTRWFASLDREKRARIRSLYQRRPVINLVGLLFVTLWLAAAGVAVSAPWLLRLPLYVIMGTALHALGILMHEAVHGNLFRTRRWNRLAAFFLGLPVLVPGAAYRVTHLLHHRHTRGSNDPDELGNYVRNHRLLPVAFYAWIVGGMMAFLLHVPVQALRHGTSQQRRGVIWETGLIVLTWSAIATAAVYFDATPLLLHGWLIPLGVVFVIVNVRGWSEHLLTVPGSVFTETRTVLSNRVVRFALLNLNYHLEHHLCPGVPWYHIPHLHNELRADFERAGACIQRSYLAFLRDALIMGVHGCSPVRQHQRAEDHG